MISAVRIASRLPSILVFTALLLAACAQSDAMPTPTPTTTSTAAQTPTPTVVSPTPAIPCEDYLALTISIDGTEEQAVVTTYRCTSLFVDSTGRQPSRSPSLVVPEGVPISFRLEAEQRPITVDVRLYSGAGISGSFLRWPEEFPIEIEAVDRSQPAPSLTFQHMPQVPPGEYSLVVRAIWEGPIDVFYALSFKLE